MKWRTAYFKIFGGWDTDTPTHLLEDERFSIFQNVNMEKPTVLETRPGCALECTCTSSVKIRGIYHDADLEIPRTYIVSDGKVWYREPSDDVFTEICSGLTVGEDASFVKYIDNLFVGTAKDRLSIVRGSLQQVGTDVFTPPKPTWLFEWNDRLFSGDGDNKRRAYYTDTVHKYEIWTQFFTVRTDIIKGVLIRDYPYLFCNDGIYQMEYDPDFLFGYQPKSLGVCPVSAKSIVMLDGMAYFLARDGAYRFDGDQLAPLGFDRMNHFFRGLDADAMKNVSGFSRAGVVYWSVPYDDKDNGAMLVYDAANDRFGLYKGAFTEGCCFTTTPNGTVFMGDEDGNLHHLFTGHTDNGTAIPFDVQRRLDMGDRYRVKRFWSILASVEKTGDHSLVFMYGPNRDVVTSSCSLASDNRWGTGVWGTMEWGDEPSDKFTFPIASGYSVAKNMVVRAYASTTVAKTRIFEFAVEWKPSTGRT